MLRRAALAALLLATAPAGLQQAAAQQAGAPAGGQQTPIPEAAAPEAGAAFDDAERAAIRGEVRAYLLENPEILREMIALLEEREAAATAASDSALVAEHAEALHDDGFSYVGGDPAGDVTVVEFLDYQCGFCRRARPDLAELIGTDGDIRLVVKELPILGPGSELAARATIATLIEDGPEAYRALGDRLMAASGAITDASLDAALTEVGLDPATIRDAMASPEVTRRLEETRGLAQALGISGTPTFVFGDRMVRGYIPLADMRALVESVRAGN